MTILKKQSRFANPGKLTESTKILGVPVKDWNQAFTGSFDKGLTVLKQRTEEINRRTGQTVAKETAKPMIDAGRKLVEVSR